MITSKVSAQVGFAFHRIEAALSVLIMKMADFSGLAAQTDRLEALLDGEMPISWSPKALQGPSILPNLIMAI